MQASVQALAKLDDDGASSAPLTTLVLHAFFDNPLWHRAACECAADLSARLGSLRGESLARLVEAWARLGLLVAREPILSSADGSCRGLPLLELQEQLEKLCSLRSIHADARARLATVRHDLAFAVPQSQINASQTSVGLSRWRTEPVLPRADELMHGTDPPPNKVQGPYASREEYVALHHALLREDFLRPLREAVGMVHAGREAPREVTLWHGVRMVGTQVGEPGGLLHMLQLPETEDAEPASSLINGTLLLVSPDRFRSIVHFAVVTRQQAARLLGDGMVFCAFQTGPSARDAQQAAAAEQAVHLAADVSRMEDCSLSVMEAGAYWGAYRPVLSALQTAGNGAEPLPLEECLLRSESCDKPPAYFAEGAKLDVRPVYNVSAQTEPRLLSVDRPWDLDDGTSLDKYQFRAAQALLTRRLGLVQGPPGTGKTFIGLLVVRTLLRNAQLWAPGSTGSAAPVAPFAAAPSASSVSEADAASKAQVQVARDALVRMMARSASAATEADASIEVEPLPLDDHQPDAELEQTAAADASSEVEPTTFEHDQLDAEELAKAIALSLAPDEHCANVTDVDGGEGNQGAGGTHELPSPPPSPPAAEPESAGPAPTEAQGTKEAECITGAEYGAASCAAHGNILGGSARAQNPPASPPPPPIPMVRGLSRTLTLDEEMETARERSPRFVERVSPWSARRIARLPHDGGAREDAQLLNDGELEDGPVEGETTGCDRSETDGGEAGMSLAALRSSGAPPILVLCHTNHALDQFLEGILKFEPRVVRVGGRSQSDVLKLHNLVHLLQQHRSLRSKTESTCRSNLHSQLRRERERLGQALAHLHRLSGRQIVAGATLRGDTGLTGSLAAALDKLSERSMAQWLLAGRLGDGDDEREYGPDDLAAVHGARELSSREVRAVCESVDAFVYGGGMGGALSKMLPEDERWGLYKAVRMSCFRRAKHALTGALESYRMLATAMADLDDMEALDVLRSAAVVGMTTTGAAKYQLLVKRLECRVVVFEEAAEVLEAHVLASLGRHTTQLLLIGDHQQLRPSVACHELSLRFGLTVSLFERCLNNSVPFVKLRTQRRMRPEISRLIKPIYPELLDHDSVANRPAVAGMVRDVFIVSHSAPEQMDAELLSPKNPHEVEVVVKLAAFLVGAGYRQEQLTILSAYVGQLLLLKPALTAAGIDKAIVSTVDAYQGEENDLVLLTLDRPYGVT